MDTLHGTLDLVAPDEGAVAGGTKLLGFTEYAQRDVRAEVERASRADSSRVLRVRSTRHGADSLVLEGMGNASRVHLALVRWRGRFRLLECRARADTLKEYLRVDDFCPMYVRYGKPDGEMFERSAQQRMHGARAELINYHPRAHDDRERVASSAAMPSCGPCTRETATARFMAAMGDEVSVSSWS